MNCVAAAISAASAVRRSACSASPSHAASLGQSYRSIATELDCYARLGGEDHVMPLRDDLHRRRDRLMATAARHGASNLRLFGSVLRGEEGADSDIDLLGELAEDRG